MDSIPVPVNLIFAVDLPPLVVQTWLVLRALAGEAQATRPCSLYELGQLTGRSRTTLYKHLGLLQAAGYLRWERCGRGRYAVAFSTGAQDPTGLAGSPVSSGGAEKASGGAEKVSAGREKASGRGEKASAGAEKLTAHSEEASAGAEKSSAGPEISSGGADSGPLLILNPPQSARRKDQKQERRPGSRASGGALGDAVEIFERRAGFRATPPQREALYAEVGDLELWRQTVDHWLLHGWNPKNVAGMLSSYRYGGEAGCRLCCPPRSSEAPPAASGQAGGGSSPGASELEALIAAARRREQADEHRSRE